MEKISIIINAYNGNRYIEKCIRSILAQDLHNKYELEILVPYFALLDTEVPTVIEGINDKRIIPIPTTRRHFSFRSILNAGFEKVSDDSRYIHFMSAMSYIIGKDFLYNAVTQVTENEEICIFKRFYYETEKYTTPYNSIENIDSVAMRFNELLYSIIFLNRKDIADMLAPYFSIRHYNRFSTDFLGTTYFLIKKIEELNPIIIDTNKNNTEVCIYNNDNWYSEFILYYLAKEHPTVDIDTLDGDFFYKADILPGLKELFYIYLGEDISVYEIKDKIKENTTLSESEKKIFDYLTSVTVFPSIDADL